MTTYMTVAARRIQQWIARTPMLRLVRGAAIALDEQTGADAVQEWLVTRGYDPFVEIAEDAGAVSGVVALRLKAGRDNPTAARPVVRDLLGHLSAQLPGIEWEAWIENAGSFSDAFRVVRDSEGQRSADRLVGLPADADFPPASACEGCGREPRELGKWIAEEQGEGKDPERPGIRDLGMDCAMRRGARDAVIEATRQAGGRPEALSFPELARRGRPLDLSRTASGNREWNHLATICADGNRMGAVFDAFIEAKLPASFRMDAAHAITEAAETALYVARLTVDKDNFGIWSDIVHYVGGDDILVSVAAPVAWEYAVTLSVEFVRALEDSWANAAQKHDVTEKLAEVKKLMTGGTGDWPGLGLGIAFAHHSHPFAACRHAAEDAQVNAKRATCGRSAAICWVDLTVESPRDVTPFRYLKAREGERLLSTTAKNAQSASANEELWNAVLTRWSNHQRGRVREILRDHWRPESYAPPEVQRLRNVVVTELLAQHSERAEFKLWEPLNGQRTPQVATDGSAIATGALDGEIAELANLLSLERWWPKR